MSKDDLPFIDRISIQMEYAVPLIRDLQQILGEEQVNAALAERIERQREAAKREAEGQTPDLSNLSAAFDMYGEGGGYDGYEVLENDGERYDVNVRGCGYAKMMERLGARDIGPLLICNLDYVAADRGGVELTRTQTCMQGAEYCDFRFRKAGSK